MFLFWRHINAKTLFASFIASESSFHARIVEGKNVLKQVGMGMHRMQSVQISKIVGNTFLHWAQ